jgi:hypothetical protein
VRLEKKAPQIGHPDTQTFGAGIPRAAIYAGLPQAHVGRISTSEAAARLKRAVADKR